MTFRRRDAVATVLVAVVLLGYGSYLVFEGVPVIRDARGMAAVGVVFGFASRRLGGRWGFKHEHLVMLAGLGSLALGFAAIGTGNGVVLAVFMASIVALWAAALYVRTDHFHHLRPARIRVAP